MIKETANVRMNDLPDEQFEAFKNLYQQFNKIIFDLFYEKKIRPDIGINILSMLISDAMAVAGIMFLDEDVHKKFIEDVLENIRFNAHDKIEMRKNRG